MFSNEELQKKFRATTPMEALEHLNAVQKSPKLPEDFRPPLLTVWLASGSSFKGYLVDASGAENHTFVFSQEIQNEGDDAADLIFVYGSRIEALTVWNVDDQPEGILPRPKK